MLGEGVGMACGIGTGSQGNCRTRAPDASLAGTTVGHIACHCADGHAVAIDSAVRDDRATQLRKSAVQLGMIGLGRMGANMAKRVMSKGHQCVVQDPNADAVASMVAAGATGAASLQELASK